ncbi:signal peptidase I [Deinococcus arenae]|uniref:Signal peptidase I n=1 Tax=Deinococcus arenae TaxID=1452751 RepID=A0A8H9GJA2_9DEIO|nr:MULTISPECIES: signal peptidase I [Deinococcus]AWT36138.1 signal peptidase I [Deinococcus actinosclerus]GGM28882.1 signal peptidase I [Deinococcus arenae]
MTTPESAPAPSKPPQTALQKLWKEILEPIVFAVVITQFVATLVGVDGVSMMPNLRNGERVFVPKYETWLHKAGVGEFKRGDILIFKPPREASAKIENLNKSAFGLWSYRPFLIKRLIGLPGDRVSIRAGEVTVNGQQLDSSWTTAFWQAQGCWDTQSEVANNVTSASIAGQTVNVVPDRQEFTVPEGQYFVMGDNRTATGSEDSRIMGAIARRDVAGRAAAVVWPIMRKTNAKYDCNGYGQPEFSGANELNWRVLTRPAGFGQLK